MRKSDLKNAEENIQNKFVSLQNTAAFLNSVASRKQAEVIFLNKRLESEYSDELFERFQKSIMELKNLEKKINWEKNECIKFDKDMEKLNNKKQDIFIGELSKKIIKSRSK